jgi:hypothetical protein
MLNASDAARVSADVRPLRTMKLLVILFAAFGLTGCTSLDLTGNHASTCEVHGIAMSKHRVELSGDPALLTEGGSELSPHAQKPHFSYCGLVREKHATIFVCPRCTEIRQGQLAQRTAQ